MFPRFFPGVIQFLDPQGERCRFRMALAGCKGRLGLVGRELFCWCPLSVDRLSRRARSLDLSKYTNIVSEGPHPNTPMFWLPLSSLRPLMLTTNQETLMLRKLDTSRLHELYLRVESEIDADLASVLPSRLRTFSVELLSSKSLQPRALPRGVTHVTLGRPFKSALRARCLPSHLRSLTFGFWYNRPLELNVLPPYLESLTFGEEYNQPIEPGVLPRALKRLQFGYWYDQPVGDRVLPPNLRQLTFGEWFNQPLDGSVLPPRLEELTLSLMYEPPLSQLREGLRTVKFCNAGSFNMPDMLPNGVAELLAVTYTSRPHAHVRLADPGFYQPLFCAEDRHRLMAAMRRHRRGSKIGFEFEDAPVVFNCTRQPNDGTYYVSRDTLRRVSTACLRLKLTRWGASDVGEELTPQSMFATVKRTTGADILSALNDAGRYHDSILQREASAMRPQEQLFGAVRVELLNDRKRENPVFTAEQVEILFQAMNAPLKPGVVQNSVVAVATNNSTAFRDRSTTTFTALTSGLSKSLPSPKRQSRKSTEIFSRRCTPHNGYFEKQSFKDVDAERVPESTRQRRCALSPPPMTPQEIRQAIGYKSPMTLRREAIAARRRMLSAPSGFSAAGFSAADLAETAEPEAATAVQRNAPRPRRTIFSSLRRRGSG